jgi:hypothetical protein
MKCLKEYEEIITKAQTLCFYKSLRQILPGSGCFVVPHDAFFKNNLTDYFHAVQLQLLQLNHCTVTAGYFYNNFAYEICFYGIYFYGIYI